MTSRPAPSCFLIALALLVAACSTGSPALTDTPLATATKTPHPTLTPTQTPTPLAHPNMLADEAASLCDATASAPVTNASPVGPVMAMLREDYEAQQAWHYSGLVPYFTAVSASEVRSILCISESRSQTGSYNDGQPAYRRNWAVRVVGFPGGDVLASRNFTGEEPPGLKNGDGPGYGAPPSKALFNWLLESLDDSSVFFVGEGVSTLTFLADGIHVAAGTERRLNVSYPGVNFDARIYILDTSTGEIARTLSGHTDPITKLAASSDGRFLASGSVKTHEYNSIVRVWDLATGRELHSVKIENSDLRGLAFAPDGTRLAILGWDKVTLVDTTSGATLNSIEPGGGAVFFSPDNLLILDTYEQIRFIDPVSGTTVRKLPTTCLSDYSDANDTFLVCGEEFAYSVIDVQDGHLISSIPNGGNWFVHDMSSNGLLALPEENKVRIWNISVQSELITFEGGSQPSTALAFSPNGDLLASGTNDGFVKVWEVP